ncbi:MAG TPA: thioester reductase domain-containing protein, partial [Actinocrinis sp.]|uniref:thioester reductase domain-containing protein n=1 Tax=Actinocrinis sp. TaxID=1920516 RepID=UPI002DDDAEF2
ARFVGGAAVGPDTDFFDAGATSVNAVELVAVLSRELGVRLSLDDVFADARPRRLAQRWLTAQGTDVEVSRLLPLPHNVAIPAPTLPADDADEDLAWIAADLALADRLPWVDPPEPIPPRRILLTGATGFLGSHMLLDLLRRSDAHVVCLVRGADDQDAERRLGEALASFQVPWSAEVRRRVTVLAGDIRRPRLGLAEEQWSSLANDVDSIVSVAAAVDFLRGYPSLRQTNVLGPLTLAEFATTGRIKPLHHISSIAVFNEVGIASMGEDDPVAHVDRLAAGYDKAKWAAEAALRRARDHGLVVTLLRPGGIGGHTQTGAYNPHDLSTGFMAAFARYRTVPAFRFLNVAPVDWVSRMAAAIVCEPEGWGQTYNLVGKPNTLPDLVREMQLGGMNIQVRGWDDWRADLLARLDAEPVEQLDFLRRVLRSPTALKLCEATLLGPAATGERAEAFAARYKLPAPVRYDTWAQVKTYERLAEDGLVHLPSRDDPPYLWFPETMVGSLGPLGGHAETPCTLSMTLSIASMYQLVQERRIDVHGEVSCSLLHHEPLTVQYGEIRVRPDEGVPRLHGTQHPLLRYRLRLRDRDGRIWWLEGQKTARARRDVWRQARTLAVEIGHDGEPPHLSGVVTVPGDSYVRQQVDGIEVNPELSAQEQRVAKLLWLAWFGSQVGRGLLEPMFRAGADLLDLRRDAALIKRERRRRNP